MTIVCIDDDPIEFESLRFSLREAGIPNDLVHITNGSAALAYAQKSNKQVVAWIIDGKFPMTETDRPGNNGPRIAHQIRALGGEDVLMIGLSSDPSIFDSSAKTLTHNLHKGRPWEFVPSIQKMLREICSQKEAISL